MGIPSSAADWQTLIDGLKYALTDKKESIVISAHVGLFNHLYALENMREEQKEREKKEKEPKKDKKEPDKVKDPEKAKEAEKAAADLAKVAAELAKMKETDKSDSHLADIVKFTKSKDPLIRMEALNSLAALGLKAVPKISDILALTADAELSIRI